MTYPEERKEAILKKLLPPVNKSVAGFKDLDDARDWVQQFVEWYNHQHKHSQLNFVSPAERHAGLDGEILQQRKLILEKAREANPNRWSGSVRNCEPAGVVMLNPDRDENTVIENDRLNTKQKVLPMNKSLRSFISISLLLSLVALLTSCARSGTALLNGVAKTGDYTATSNIAYGTSPMNKLDVYRPNKSTNKSPVVVFFYGGCWGECNSLEKSDYLFVAQSFASRGYVTVIANFRQYPEVRFDGLMSDVSKVVSWVAQHISDYGGDPNRLVLAGHSSGAHVAIMLALNSRYLQTSEKQKIRGAIGFAGPYDFLPLTEDYQRKLFAPANGYAASQPINFLTASSPPLLLLHGKKDTTVGQHNAVNLARKAQSMNVPHQLVIYPQHDHVGILVALSRPFQRRSTVLNDSLNFIRQNTQ